MRKEDAMIAYMEPVIPCIIMETRACTDIPTDPDATELIYRDSQCENICARFGRKV